MSTEPSEKSLKPILNNYALHRIMEQAQVFASAWALVGTRFDDGGAMETANEEKAALRTLLERYQVPEQIL